jgi:predicted DNA-binding transcriptional regulator YafY
MKTPQELAVIIFSFLKEKPHTVEEIYKRLLKLEIEISKRSVYRYLNKIESSLLIGTNQLEIEQEEKNKRTYFIREKFKSDSITDEEWINFINNNFLFQALFNETESEKQLNAKISNFIKSNASLKSQLLSILNAQKEYYHVSKFGELFLSKKDKKNLFKFMYYFSQNACLEITNYSSSVKSNQYIPEVNTALIPLKIWYHRGNYAFSFYSLKNERSYTIEIDMIDAIGFSKEKYNKSIFLAELEKLNNNSFGYHLPLVKGVQKVILEFPPNPGEHILNRFWHASQKMEKLENGHVLLHLSVEINIELIGWIAMWLDNVKIIAPEILKTEFKNRLINMNKILIEDSNPINNG